MIFLLRKALWRASHILYSSRKIVISTKVRHRDTNRRVENEITMKTILVVFFLRLYTICRILKNTLGIEAPANAAPFKALKSTIDIHFQQDLGSAKETLVRAPSHTTQACNSSPTIQMVGDTGPCTEQIKVATPKASQLLSLIDTPTAKNQRERTDLASPTITVHLSLLKQTQSRQCIIAATTSLMPPENKNQGKTKTYWK